MKYNKIIHAIKTKAPGNERSGSEEQKWIVIDGLKKFRVTYPKKHAGEVPIGTLHSMRKQLKLEKRDFDNFANCTMSGTEYLAYLRELMEQGKI